MLRFGDANLSAAALLTKQSDEAAMPLLANPPKRVAQWITDQQLVDFRFGAAILPRIQFKPGNLEIQLAASHQAEIAF
jgi:hypothetical protein